MQNITVEYDSGTRLQQTAIKTTPSMSLKQIVEQACTKFQLDPRLYALKLKRQELDLSLSVRLANLGSGARVTLVYKGQSTGGKVTVRLQLESERYTDTFDSLTSLWDILLHFERKQSINLVRLSKQENKGLFQKKNVYMMPVVIFMNQELSTQQVLVNTTLNDVGLQSGNGVLRLLYKPVDGTDEDHIDPNLVSKPLPPIVSPQPSLVPQKDSVPPKQDPAVPQKETSSVPPKETPTVPAKQEPVVPPKEAPIVPKKEPQPTQISQQPTVTSQQTTVASQGTTVDTEEMQVDDTTEETVAPVERNLKYYAPPKFAGSRLADLPDSFFELSQTEMKILLSSYKSSLSKYENRPLMTQKMREQEQQVRNRKYPKTLIRVRFPDQTTLEAAFYSGEQVRALFQVVQSVTNTAGFRLYVTPPMKDLTETGSFWQQQLAPSSLVHDYNIL
ncbi:GLUT4 regulating protein TUG-domain-containing protein, partial [Gorgonomyces haynaldii]